MTGVWRVLSILMCENECAMKKYENGIDTHNASHNIIHSKFASQLLIKYWTVNMNGENNANE